jgi:hypothetical protein
MKSAKIGRNELCPCDSGKKYKRCCWGKGFAWTRGDDGSIEKSIPLTAEAVQHLQQMKEEFRQKHGRDPGPDDKVFGDLEPEIVEHEMTELMKHVGIRPELIYAFNKTGRMLTEQNKKMLTDAELQEWQGAIDEYRMLHLDD